MASLERFEWRRLRTWAGSTASIQPYWRAKRDDRDEIELPGYASQRVVASDSKLPIEFSNSLLDTKVAALSPGDEIVFSNNRPHPWVKGLYLCGYATVCLLLINIIFVGVAGGLASKHPGTGGSSNSKVIYSGSCDSVDKWNSALHVLINVISTGVLAAGNYCMQTLVAPTRDEINRSHAKHRWLDIGAASIRNLLAISWTRKILCLVLLLTTTPFHLIYNSMIFESLVYNQKWTVIGPHDLDPQNLQSLATPALEKCFGVFPNNTWTNTLSWDQLILQTKGAKTQIIPANECYDYAVSPSFSREAFKGLILLNELQSGNQGDLSILDLSIWNDPESLSGTSFMPLTNSSTPKCFNPDPNHWDSYGNSTTVPVHITNCLAFEGKHDCQLFFSPLVGAIVTITTLVKVIVIFVSARMPRSRSPSLLTTGDAIASFLESPDKTTEGICWASESDIKKGHWSRSPRSPEGETLLQKEVAYQRLPPAKRWMNTSSPIRWLGVIVVFTAGIISGSIVATNQVREFYSNSPDSSSSAGFWSQLWDPEEAQRYQSSNIDSYSELYGIFISNCPQLLVTAWYYFYNSTLTDMLSAVEYSSYGAKAKPLRVTWPVQGSKQLSTYWLCIPYHYGIPIMLLFTAVHWFVSQSCNYTLLIPYDIWGNLLYAEKVSVIVGSGLPLGFAVGTAFLLIVILVVLSFRRLPSIIPVAGSCSAAISAACHPPGSVDCTTAAHNKLIWGETSPPFAWNDSQIETTSPRGHCSFTPHEEAMRPSPSKLYA